MSCLVNTVRGSHVLRMAAEMVLVLCQLKQSREWGLPPGFRKQDVWRHSEDVARWPASLPDPLTLSPAAWPSAPPYSVVRNRGQQPQAQRLSLYILLAVDMVKIISDVLGTLCRTWLILDSSFLKFIPSIRPPFDFILGPKTFLISYVYIFNQQFSKKVL